MVATASNQLSINSTNIALIACDSYTGAIQPGYVLSTAENNNAIAVVFYSEQSNSCNISGSTPSLDYVYTMKSVNDSTQVLNLVGSLGGGSSPYVNAQIGSLTTDSNNTNSTTDTGGMSSTGNSSSGGQPTQQNPLGPSPSTAVAMIILYSITGIITALFLVIIITGAVRAHRHPERYGPRGGAGRPRQSRARGLARAMLESLPIVKVGQREDEPKRPEDVELVGTERTHGDTAGDEQARAQQESAASGAAVTTATHESSTMLEHAESSTPADGAIAGAQAKEQDSDILGCSICTEDFKVGEDQRVLPCDHRFHPECIDPWLLNVSGTCPLCRIDLRPSTARTSDEVDEDGGVPPLESDGPRRISVRRSILLGITGIRPDRLSREERIMALRQMRGQGLARRRDSQAGSTPEEAESSLRRRLRNAFRIRTRRLGDEEAEPAQPQTQSQPEVPARQEGVASSHDQDAGANIER